MHAQQAHGHAASAHSGPPASAAAGVCTPTPPAAKPGTSLKGRALRLLAARDYGRAELERKLHAHAPSPEALQAALDDLQAKGFISDARAAASLVHRRANKLGNSRVLQELRSKGLDAQAIETAAQDLAASEFARARAVWQKKFGSPAQDAAARAKQVRFLASRGFASATIARVLKAAGCDADWDDTF